MKGLVLWLCLSWLVLAEVRVFLPWAELKSRVTGEIPAILSHLRSRSWPKFTFDGSFLLLPVTLKMYSVHITALSTPNVTISILNPHQVEVTFSNITAALSFNWTAEYLYSFDGQGEILLSDVSFHAKIRLGNSAGTLALTPQVRATVGQVDINVEGTYLDWVYETLMLLEEDWVRTELEKRWGKGVQNVLAEKLQQTAISPIWPLQRSQLQANLSLLAAPYAESRGVTLDIKGAFGDAEGECYESEETPLSSFAAYDKSLAVLSVSTLSSWLEAINSAELSGWTVHPFSIPATANVSLTTAGLEETFPGLVQIYGDKQTFLVCEFVVTPEVILTDSKAQLSSLELCFFRILHVSAPFARATVRATYSWQLTNSGSELLGQVYPVDSKVLDVDVDYAGVTKQSERKAAVEKLLAELWSAAGPFQYPSRGVLLPASLTLQEQRVHNGCLEFRLVLP